MGERPAAGDACVGLPSSCPGVCVQPPQPTLSPVPGPTTRRRAAGAGYPDTLNPSPLRPNTLENYTLIPTPYVAGGLLPLPRTLHPMQPGACCLYLEPYTLCSWGPL